MPIQFMVQFKYKNGHGLHGLHQDDHGTLVVYQSPESRIRLNKGDYALVSIAHMDNKVIKRGNEYFRVCHVWIKKIITTGQQITERESEFDRLYDQFFPVVEKQHRYLGAWRSQHLMAGKSDLKWQYAIGDLIMLDVELELRKELYKLEERKQRYGN